MLAISLSLLSAVLYGFGDFWGALASRRTHVLRVVPLIIFCGGLTVASLIPFLGATFSQGAIVSGIGAGIFGSLGFFLFYRALAIGPMGIASAIIAVVAASIPYFFDVIQGTHITALGTVGAVVALASIVLVSRSTEDATHPVTSKMVKMSLAAGIIVGGFFLGLSFAPSDSGVAAFTVTRITQLTIMTTAYLVVRKKIQNTAKPNVRMAIATGIFDALGAVAFIYATRTGSLATVAVVSNLYPAVTLFIAHFVIHERVERHQYLGMGGAVASVALLTLA